MFQRETRAWNRGINRARTKINWRFFDRDSSSPQVWHTSRKALYGQRTRVRSCTRALEPVPVLNVGAILAIVQLVVGEAFDVAQEALRLAYGDAALGCELLSETSA